MDNYDDYIKRYAEQHGITIEEAETHALVQEVKKFYKEGQNEDYFGRSRRNG